MRSLRRLYSKRKFGDPVVAMLADALLLAVVLVSALFLWAVI